MATIQYQNKEIFYRVVGNGKPLLLLHGFGEDGRVFEPLQNRLSDDFKVIVPDLPGSGRSHTLAGEGSMEDYAAVVRKISQQEFGRGTPFTLIGHSMGGYITMAYADCYPEDLNSFGLFHSSPLADTPDKIESRKKNIEFIRRHGLQAFFETVVPGLFAPRTKELHPEKIARLLEISDSVKEEAAIQYLEAMIKRASRQDVLQEADQPVLLIAGRDDTVIPISTFLSFCSLPKIAQINILENSGHSGMLEEEEMSEKHIREFMEKFA